LEYEGIQTRPVWGLIHEQKPYTNDVAYETEKAHYYGVRVLNIPCSSGLTDSDVHRVVDCLFAALRLEMVFPQGQEQPEN
jgi:perosamine synthetase